MRSDLVPLSINPVPSGASVRLIEGFDGAKLRTALWQPTRGPVRGTVVVVPGRSEYIEKYFEVITDLRRRGFAVAIADLRGQGGSERLLANPRKGYVGAFTEYDRDLEHFLREMVMPALPAPYIALGHSLGGNILLRNAQDEASPFARMILVSPMIEINRAMLDGASPKAVRVYAEVAAALGFATSFVKGGSEIPTELTNFEGNDLTSDRARWSRNRAVIEAAADLSLGSPTIGWLRAALRSSAMLRHREYPRYVSVPMLLFAAGSDRVVSSRAIEDFAVDLKIGGHILMPGSRHEILQENDDIRQRFWAAFDAYMGADLPAATS